MNLYRRVLLFLKPYWKIIIAAFIASLIYAVFNSLTIWMSATFIDTIFTATEKVEQNVSEKPNVPQTGFSLNTFLKNKTNAIIQQDSKTDTLMMVCIIIFIAFILKNIFGYLKGILITYVNYNTVNDVRNKVFAHLVYLPLGYHEKRRAGEITSIAVNDVGVLTSTLTNSFSKLIVTPIEILTLISILLIISWKLTLVVFLLIPVLVLVIAKIGSSIRRKSRRTLKQTALFINILQESILALRVVKAFATEIEEVKKFKNATKKYFKLAFRQKTLELLSSPINELLGVTVAIILLWYGGTQVLTGGGITSEDFVRFIIVLFSLFQPMKQMSGINNQIQAGLSAAERVFDILDTVPTIMDSPDAIEISDFKKDIEIKDVSFRYNDEPFVLKNIKLNIKRGEVVAFVGHSGVGKSTLIDIIPRFYDVTEGEILIDGINIKHIKNEHLKNLFGIVTQETILFNDSLKNNIAYGSANSSNKDIENASKVAHAFDFITNMEEGFNTIVGDRGVKLSGGQRQRIAIARAILKNPPILILDEATSSLDTESEKLVQQAIDKLMKNRTVLVIAHRLSTITHADKIIVINKGEIAGMGPHKELLKSCAIYKSLYENQLLTK